MKRAKDDKGYAVRLNEMRKGFIYHSIRKICNCKTLVILEFLFLFKPQL